MSRNLSILLLIVALSVTACGKKPGDVDAPKGATAAPVYPPLDDKP